MSRKKIVPNYAISLDIGNASVGWAAFTPDYRLMRAKGRELIGVRLFEPAQTAEARRMARTTRRRYSRRRWRLHMLDAIFDAPLAEVDPSFLARRKYSWVHPADENNADYWYGSVLFDSKNQDKRFFEIIYVFLTIFLYLPKCPQSLILSALRAFCFCGKPRISRSIFLYFPCQSWLKSW